MANPFDQFDAAPAAGSPVATGGANPFDQFDEQPKHSPWEMAAAIPELIGSGLSHGLEQPFLEGAAGLVARMSGHDPAAAHAWADSKVYNTPEGSLARGITDSMHASIAPIINPVGHAINNADEFIGKYGGAETQKLVRQTLGTASDIAGVVPGVGVLAKGLKDMAAAARPIEEAAQVARAPDELAKALNIRVPPSIIDAKTGVAAKPGATAKVGESVGGHHAMLRDDIIHNRSSVNGHIKDELGTPQESVISKATLDAADAPHAAVYDKVREALPDPVMLPPEFQSEIASAGKNPDSVRPLPASAEREIANASELPPMNGRQLIGTISDYRAKGWKGLLSDDVDQQAIGATQLDIANALEKQLTKAVDARAPGLSQEWQQARVGFAKNNTIRKALVGHDVDPQKLVKLAKKNEGITGKIKAIADLAEQIPEVMTIKVPKLGFGGTMSSMGIHYGLPGMLGFAAGGLPGAVIGATVVGPALQKGTRMIMNAARNGTPNARAAVGTALADYAGKKATGGFHPSQKPTGKDLALIPGQDYSPPIPPRGESIPLRGEVATPQPEDAALADAVRMRHPGSERPILPRLPAPGQLASADVAIPESLAASERVAGARHPGSPQLPNDMAQALERWIADESGSGPGARRAGAPAPITPLQQRALERWIKETQGNARGSRYPKMSEVEQRALEQIIAQRMAGG